MSAGDAFKLLQSDYLAPALRDLGFKRSGQTFGIRGNGVWGILNLQRSTSSNANLARFTVNVSVWSDLLAEHNNTGDGLLYSKKLPPEPACHWRTRIGQFMPGGNDHWWDLGPAVDAKLATMVVDAVRDSAVPELLSRQSDADLYRMLRANPVGGLTAGDQAVLYQAYATPQEFQAFARTELSRLAGRPYGPFFKSRLAKLGYPG
jgi:hypothetical protein